MKNIKRISFKRMYILILIITAFVILICINDNEVNTQLNEFDEIKAYQHIIEQVNFGARYPGSAGHENVQKYIIETMELNGWNVTKQAIEVNGHIVNNIICNKGSGDQTILLGAHYDTRKLANGEGSDLPVPGANDGASGVAVLLELARLIPDNFDNEMFFVFFDHEDNGGIEGAEWAMGSTSYVDTMEITPDSVIIIDMVGDADLNIFRENNSSKILNDVIWGIAHNLGYEEFIDEEKYNLIDDHLPFVNGGYEATLIIDFEYEFWHTTEDTIDKISANSLKVVGDTIASWINQDHSK